MNGVLVTPRCGCGQRVCSRVLSPLLGFTISHPLACPSLPCVIRSEQFSPSLKILDFMPLNHSTAALLSPFLPLTQEAIFVDLVSDLERHEASQKLENTPGFQVKDFIYCCYGQCLLDKSLQSCPTLLDSMDCSPPGSSVHGILQARILEWVALPFSRGSSWPNDSTQVSCTAGRFFTFLATREAHKKGAAWWFEVKTSRSRKHCYLELMCTPAKSLQLCSTPCDPMDCSPWC